MRLSLAIQALARQKAPAAGSIMVVTNLNDPDLDNSVTDRVVELWRAHGARDVQTYQFPVELALGHELTDRHQLDQKTASTIAAVVYPKLLELIDR
jgi:hypothetical protein